jgi:hypothetical protein
VSAVATPEAELSRYVLVAIFEYEDGGFVDFESYVLRGWAWGERMVDVGLVSKNKLLGSEVAGRLGGNAPPCLCLYSR